MRKSHFLVVICSFFLYASSEPSDNLKTYIVHVNEPPPEHGGSHHDWHVSFLPHPSRLVYSYSHILNAFAARLTEAELEAIKSTGGFAHVVPATALKLHTTHSPTFLGLNRGANGLWNGAAYGSGVIIGILDTGIAPSHPSFHDEGMPPPPPKWKGKCDFSTPYRCNNKIIGAVCFDNTDPSSLPFDNDGHGTHTASTAAGSFVANSSFLGNAGGVAAGIAPGAHLAIYKVCSFGDCWNVDILAAMEQAVIDGVDVISISLGGMAEKYHDDSIAIGSFGASRKGVFVSASAGNGGPTPASLHNLAPWMLSVGASTTDRKIVSVVKLGDGQEFRGQSAYQPPDFPTGQLPLEYSFSNCFDKDELEHIGVKNKVVVCDAFYGDGEEQAAIVREAGGAAAIIVGDFSDGFETEAAPYVLPASQVTYSDGYDIYYYVSSAWDVATARIIFEGTRIGDWEAPAVASFSSRGPNPISPGILKPDVIGPGVGILAAWPSPVGPFPVEPPFNMISGTSMSCPHLAGVAALLKSLHPNWSPAMIRSAIITTTDVTNLNGDPIIDLWRKERARFDAMGAGHVNPVRAANPGLVYDIETRDYVGYLCGLGYTPEEVRVVTGEDTDCGVRIDEANLNYPSFSVRLGGSSMESCVVVRRTVTNVGMVGACYVAAVVRPEGLRVNVEPKMLCFGDVGETQTFTVAFSIDAEEASRLYTPWVSEGFLIWASFAHHVEVRSPISVRVG